MGTFNRIRRKRVNIRCGRASELNPFPFLQGLLAGGAVRDYLLGRTPADYDYFYKKRVEDDKRKEDEKLLKTNGATVVKIGTPKKDYPWRVPSTFELNGKTIQLITTPNIVSPQPATGILDILVGFDLTACMFAADPMGDIVHLEYHGSNASGYSWKLQPCLTLKNFKEIAWRRQNEGADTTTSSVIALHDKILSAPVDILGKNPTTPSNVKRLFDLQRRLDFRIEYDTLISIMNSVVKNNDRTFANNDWLFTPTSDIPF